jgi:hypothetical protein
MKNPLSMNKCLVQSIFICLIALFGLANGYSQTETAKMKAMETFYGQHEDPSRIMGGLSLSL